MAMFIVFWSENRKRKRKFRIVNSEENGNGTWKRGMKTLIPPSGKSCPYCFGMIANSDPDGENVPDSNERRHKSCVRLAIARSKNTELREAANL